MRKYFVVALVLAGLFSLPACVETGRDSHGRSRPNRFGANGTQGVGQQMPADQQPVTDVPPVEAQQKPEVTPPPPPHSDAPKPSGVAAPKKDYPYGTPVPGKSGFVTSPHAPYSGYVDVRGFPPGTEVKDPYTGKVFLVP